MPSPDAEGITDNWQDTVEARLADLEARVSALEGVEPDPDPPPTPDYPFAVAPPNPANIRYVTERTMPVDLINVAGRFDHVWTHCVFRGGPSQNGFGVRYWDKAPINKSPALERGVFSECEFFAEDRYPFWCNGSISDCLFDGCAFGPSIEESSLRIYNGRRLVFRQCVFNNEFSAKSAARIINSDFVMFDGCTFLGPLWINQNGPAGGWFGRIWVHDCIFYPTPHTCSRPINVHINSFTDPWETPPPPEITEHKVVLERVASTSRIWDSVVNRSPFVEEIDCSHRYLGA